MKTIDKIIESKEAPKDKNVLWVNGDKLLAMVKGKWTPVGGGNSSSTKNQDKSVDITENGVTEVTADSGYTGLGKVTINANVQSGGSGGDAPSQPSGGNMEYWDVTAAPGGASEISQFLLLLKYTKNELPYIQSIVSLRHSSVTPIAVALDRSVKMANSTDGVMSVGEIFQQQGVPEFSAIGWVQITEEEFYTL